MNTTDFLSISAAICPDRPALIFDNRSFTFSELNERSTRLGNALLKLGVKKGDRVATLQVNCHQSVETYFAVAKISAIYLPLNFRTKGDELTYMLNNAEAVVLLVGDRYIELVKAIKPKLTSVKHFISMESKQPGMLYYEDLVSSALVDDIAADINEDDITILMYTAGTTGFPKGVMLPHKSFTVYVLENVPPADPTIEERNILTVPLYHVAGIQAIMAAVYGGRTIILERQFAAEEWLALVEKEKASRAMMVPTMLKQLMDNPEFKKHDLSSLKVITYGAAPMPLEVISRALELFPGVSFINAFGQTETASTVTMLGPEDHHFTGKETPAEREKKLKRLSSIGRPMPDVEMKVVDENGKELLPGVVGEIIARGPRIMSGYWKDQEKTAKTIDKDGWVHTNDMGYRDEEGYFFLAGRATDMIKRGGEFISPEELEAVLHSYPKIEEAAIIGVPDIEWGEEPRAICVLKKGATCSPEEIMEYCRAKMASFKRPRSVVFVNELPRNPMGKVLKRVLREQYGKP